MNTLEYLRVERKIGETITLYKLDNYRMPGGLYSIDAVVLRKTKGGWVYASGARHALEGRQRCDEQFIALFTQLATSPELAVELAKGALTYKVNMVRRQLDDAEKDLLQLEKAIVNGDIDGWKK